MFITGLALFAFVLPHLVDGESLKTAATFSSFLMIAAVFLMGTHSAFFRPGQVRHHARDFAHEHPLAWERFARGDELVSQILGTSFGGIMYYRLKAELDPTAPGGLILKEDWIIGAVLFGLAFIGAAFSFLVAKVPAAAPDRQLTLNPLVPLAKNFGELRRSRPLVLATIGIRLFHVHDAVSAADTALPRREYQGTQRGDEAPALQAAAAVANDGTAAPLPQKKHNQLDELWISMLVAMLGFGVGAGCGLAGKLSGSRLELGLVPAGNDAPDSLDDHPRFVARPPPPIEVEGSLSWELLKTAGAQWPTVVCLVAIGVAAGLYIVPLYTLLQHRAPKDSKGNMVATSNFVNVTGGLLAVVMFYGVTYLFQTIQGNDYSPKDLTHTAEYAAQVESHQSIPRMLFFTASGATLLVLLAFVRLRPDFCCG